MKILPFLVVSLLLLASCSSSNDKNPETQSEAVAGESELGTGDAPSSADGEPSTTTDDPPPSLADDSLTTIDEPPAPPSGTTTDEQATETDNQPSTSTDTLPTTGASTIVSQLVNAVDDNGDALSGWNCLSQNEEQVAFFVFLGDQSGSVQTSANQSDVDITWSESPDNSILMDIASPGDSQLQSIVFSDPENFTTTDSSIAGVAPGPLSCRLTNLPGSASPDDESESIPPSVLEQAVEDALDVADGDESSVADINSILPGPKWSCTITGESSISNYSIEFQSDGAGFLSEFPIAWSTVGDTPGLVVLSVTGPNDGAIGGITLNNSNYFTAAFGRFGNTYIVPDGLVECIR